MNKQPLLTKNDLTIVGILMLIGICLGAIMYVGMYLLAPDSMTRVYLLAVASVIVGVAVGNILSSSGLFKIIDDTEFKKDNEVKVDEIVENEVTK